jgi:hypothetical protein
MSSPLEKPEGLSWDAASVELPPVPMLPPGADAMSMTISAVLPTLTTPLTASVVALSAKENMFSGKLGAAQSAYQNADDSGQQSVGQLTGMLGQLGQMAQQAGGPAQALGGQAGTFGSMMQQAMQAAKGGGSGEGGASQSAGSQGGGAPAAAAPAGSGGGQAAAGSSGAGAPQPQARDGASGAGQEQAPEPQHEDRDAHQHDGRDERQDEARRERPPVEAAGPGDSGRHAAGPPPVAPPEAPRRDGEDDLARRM